MKVIVVGAGLIGVTTAYFLRLQGHAVSVFDRKEAAGMDTSFANGGMLTPSQSEPWNQPGIFWKSMKWLGDENSPFLVRPRALFSMIGWGLNFLRNSSPQNFYLNLKKNARLAAYSLMILRELRLRLDLQYDANARGSLKIFTDSASWDEMTARSRLYADLGIACRLLDAQGVIQLEPSLVDMDDTIVGGIYYPDDESGDAHKFCRSLAEEARRSGVRFHHTVEITGFAQAQGRITAVTTGSGNHTADIYVLAAGSYSTGLAKTLGLSLPICPVKGYSLTVDIDRFPEGCPGMPVINESMHIGVVPLGDRLRIAGTAELSGFDLQLRKSRLDNMYHHARRMYPKLSALLDRDSIIEWAGLRPYSSDGVPILGRTRYDNLFLNTGHGHLGWSMAAGSGKLVADIISGTRPALDPEPYRLGR